MFLENKTAIVTGAGSGLGAAIARQLVKHRTQVFGLARSSDKLNSLKTELGLLFHPISLDISDQPKVSSWFKQTFSKELKPDILINNAGAGVFGKIEELPLDRWKQMMDTNLNGMYYLTREVVPHMKTNSASSHIINVGSILGKTSGMTKSAYSTTKFGVQGFSEALFKELRFQNIKVTCFNPGSIDTWFFEESGIEPHANMLQPDDLAEMIVHILQTPDNFLVNDMTIRPLDPRS
ncbi:MAG: SDR family oxidoreductase [Gracilimonas sp.]|uniref:SDR family oxidoreductase n=1 Tax=Gracilimonas sp. TaxID=1974203 RepID=UPI0037507F04|nr:SDR family oxidoreductase [Gracilimonas sp.]